MNLKGAKVKVNVLKKNDQPQIEEPQYKRNSRKNDDLTPRKKRFLRKPRKPYDRPYQQQQAPHRR